MITEQGIILIWFPALVVFFILFAWVLCRMNSRIGTTAKAGDIVNRWSTHAKPTVGGIIFLCALAGWSVFHAIQSHFDVAEQTLILGGCAAFLLGLWDDVRRIRASQKLAGQLVIAACAAFVFIGDIYLPLCSQLRIETIKWMWFSVVFVATAGMMNSVNMLDNMDGISAISAIPVFLIPFFTGGGEVMLPLWIIAGLIGFLVFNLPKSKIYMGDSGSLLLGFMISWIIVHYHDQLTQAGGCLNFFLVLTASCTLYLADTSVVVINRLRHGISPARGGRDHTTHNLVYAGCTERQVAGLFAMLALVQVLIIRSIAGVSEADGMCHIALVFGYFFLLFSVFFLISVGNLRKGKYAYKK
jgi:UDP-GlcNAc:undecaprenyl-phosphate GlcNAc-1-phosphate transferase